MKPRPRNVVAAAATAALVAVPLAGCSNNSHVGQAASVNGQRISESDVNRYVTPQSKPVSMTAQGGGSTAVSPRAFVVQILVYNQLLHDLLAKTKGGAPDAGELAQRERTVLTGKTAKAVANSLGVTGYTAAFNRELVRRLAFAAALQDRQQRGADVNKLAQKLDIRVSLSPRYGHWDAKTLSIDTRQEAGVPSFVTLQPTPSGSAAAALTNP